MTTSRTGTSLWKAIRRKAISRAIREGRDRCPSCGAQLDLHGTGDGAKVEVDHVIPFANGGADSIENTAVMCQTCNRRKGKGQTRRGAAPIVRAAPPTLIQW